MIDAADGHLIPGILDAHSHIAIDGGVNEGSLAVTAMVGIEDVLDPDDIGIYRALAGGVTAANLLHGSANPNGDDFRRTVPLGGVRSYVQFACGGE